LGDQIHWFDRVEVLERGREPKSISVTEVPSNVLKKLTAVRKSFLFESFLKPIVVGILNITPDSFSDGGNYMDFKRAFNFALEMLNSGVDVIDIGGESTRPGADELEAEIEISRIEPVIKKILTAKPSCKISVDTRKSVVMERSLNLGVKFINDVSALSFDTSSTSVIAENETVICLMHGGLNPKIMQESPQYENVVLNVYDYLEERIENAVNKGIKRENIVIDPGIGFAKTIEHNVSLIRNASLFHCLGVPVLYGVSRKSFIGHFGNVNKPSNRFPGSMSVALELIRQGVQLIRVHDISKTKQALALWHAIN
tara:strand:+ start:557 stop:1495 length:939 start_codon:yes stop_codon:yes gene_type:complete